MAATQSDTLRMFAGIGMLRRIWPGSLLVGVGLNDAGRALALASLAAGAAALFLDEDEAQVRAAQREGCCTFTVTSLDEALRILKNEVRQRRAIAVALGGSPAAWLQDMVQRGVQPQAFAASQALLQAEAHAAGGLCQRGMETFCGLGLCRIGSSIDLDDVLSDVTRDVWTLSEERAVNLIERRAQDAELVRTTTQEGPMGLLAKQWLKTAPALFPRALNRAYWQKNQQPGRF